MKLHPLDDRIVVRPGESEETTASGLVIPDTAKEKPQQGEVIAVGPGRRSEDTGELIPMDVKVGDTVVYSKYGGTEYILEGEDVLILSSRDILAKVGLIRPVGLARSGRSGLPAAPVIPGPARRPPSSFRHQRAPGPSGLERSSIQSCPRS